MPISFQYRPRNEQVRGWFRRTPEIFEEAEENAPSIIFIDEIDAIAPKRESFW